jgi:hypothetical protein
VPGEASGKGQHSIRINQHTVFPSVRWELYTSGMADPITFRPTSEDTENLAILTADGTSPTRAIRHALEIAAHNKRQEDLRADAARLAADPEYQEEIRAVREELDELRAW